MRQGEVGVRTDFYAVLEPDFIFLKLKVAKRREKEGRASELASLVKLLPES